MNDNTPRAVLACIGLALAVFMAGAVVVLLSYGRGYYDAGYSLTAVFPTSSQGVFTDGGSEVKMRGVTIGTISGVALLPDGRARYTLRIDHGTQVPATATVAIEPLSVFGPKFVNIVPGPGETTGPYLHAGDEIAHAVTGSDLTEVLDHATKFFTAVDANDVITIFDAISTAVRGRGDDIGKTIDAASTLVDVADRDRALLAQFLPDGATVASTLASRSDRFITMVDDLRTVTAVVGAHGSELSHLLDTTVAIADRAGSLIDDTANDFDVTVHAVADVLAGIFDERALLPKALDTIGAFFQFLGAPMRLPGPNGKTLVALKGFITVDLCLVYGVCVLPSEQVGVVNTPPLAGSAAAGGPTGTPEADTTNVTALADLLIPPAKVAP
jgi:phospholipid/cholesterol/gamma-HCH transport system substrate-binding protein